MSKKSIKYGSLSILGLLLPKLWIKKATFKIRLILACSCLLVSVGLCIITPLLFRMIIDNLTDMATLPGASYKITMLLLAYGVSWSLSKIIVQFGELLIFKVLARGIQTFSSDVFKHLINLSASFHLNRKTGAITEAIFRAQEGIADIFWGLFFSIVPLMIEMTLVTGIITYLYGIIYGAAFASIIAMYILFSYLGIEWFSSAQERLNKIKMRTGARVVDSLLNYETVKVFGNTEHEIEQSQHIFSKLENAFVTFAWRMDLVHAGQAAIIGLGLTVMTLMTGKEVLLGTFSIGDFTMINWYILQFVSPLSYLGKILKDVRKGINNVENTIEIMHIPQEIKDKFKAKDLDSKNPEIKFENVSFSYHDKRPILREVSFKVSPGQTLALVGMTGSGKSTIARLLYRFFDVDNGSIKINGTDLRDLTQESLHNSIGIVPQDTVLFNDTLFYNIAYGNLEAEKSQVEAAIQKAHLKKLIQAMPDGINTPVGERGLKLSGGEKQRVAIARVILKQPSIYIFDEATSALDTKTEQQIHENLKEISKGCTTLIIAHRLSTVIHADKIIVLEHGRVHESGTHQELLQLDGLYARMYRQQIA